MSYSSLSYAPDFSIYINSMSAQLVNLLATGDNARLTFITGVPGGQNWTFFGSRVSGGGLGAGQFSLFSYNSSTTPVQQVMLITPQTDAVIPSVNFFASLSSYHFVVNNNLAGAPTAGQVQLSATGNIVVPTTAVSGSSTVLVSYLNNGAPIIPLSVAITNGTSFTVTGDINQYFSYLIIN